MLKNIVLDLDGTLWQTFDSYKYAYSKLCLDYGLKEDVDNEQLQKCLGVKLNDVVNVLFPTIKDKLEIAKKGLEYSIEYIINNPENCCYDGVKKALQTLSKNYQIYIISNCPKEYVETFLKVSDTAKYIKNYYTLEQGEKQELLSEIVLKGQEKTLFVGDSEEDYFAIKDHYNCFFCFAEYGYKSCFRYDYKIKNLLELEDVIGKIEIKERQLVNKKYKVFSYLDNQLTLILNNNGEDYFGFINYVDKDFENVIIDLKNEKQKDLIGPIDGNTFYSYRFAVDHFDIKFYPDCDNGAEVVELFKKHGFTFKQFYVSTIATVNERMWKLSKRVKLPKGYSVKVVSGKDAYKYLDEIYEVTIDAFSEADYYEEISKKDFIDIYMKNIDAVSPDLILFFDNNELVAYNFCYEDPLKRYYVCKTTAIKKTNRNKGLIMLMVDYSYSILVKRGYKYALHHFQNDRTKTLHAIFRGHEVTQKRYALMELKSDK